MKTETKAFGDRLLLSYAIIRPRKIKCSLPAKLIDEKLTVTKNCGFCIYPIYIYICIYVCVCVCVCECV